MVLNRVLLLNAVVSKLVPLIETEVPLVPIVGVKLLIVGALELTTVKLVALEIDPAGEVTLIKPVVAPEGTLVTILVAVDEVTVAAVPLNVTVLLLGVVLNAVPQIVTEVPIVPLPGVNAISDIDAEL